jgi:type IV pilus assembly protein PilA
MSAFQPPETRQQPVRVTQTAALGTLGSHRWSGFTLLELLIVASIVGILSAIVLPQYLRARAVAEASTIILETVAFAEQCAVAHKSGLPVVVAQPGGGPTRNCNGTAARRLNSRRWSGDAGGILCLGVPAGSTHRRAILRVSMDGAAVTCSFSS